MEDKLSKGEYDLPNHMGNMTAEQEEDLLKKVVKGKWQLAKEKAMTDLLKEQALSFEEAFEKLQVATGFAKIEDFVSHFIQIEELNFRASFPVLQQTTHSPLCQGKAWVPSSWRARPCIQICMFTTVRIVCYLLLGCLPTICQEQLASAVPNHSSRRSLGCNFLTYALLTSADRFQYMHSLNIDIDKMEDEIKSLQAEASKAVAENKGKDDHWQQVVYFWHIETVQMRAWAIRDCTQWCT